VLQTDSKVMRFYLSHGWDKHTKHTHYPSPMAANFPSLFFFYSWD
jgi:hypothetical protein